MGNKLMKAMILDSIYDLSIESSPLKQVEFAIPRPGPEEVLIKISVCGICHTELDEIEGRTPPPLFPVIPGHQVVGNVVELGQGAGKMVKTGDRVGVAWIFSSCGNCEYCLNGLENLCPEFAATGRDRHGGYAEFMVVPEISVFKIPNDIEDVKAAPLLCAGAIGYRALKLTGLWNGQSLGLTGFGASGHIVLKMAREIYPESEVFVFARSKKERLFALQNGASWSGDTTEKPPCNMDAIIDTTPAWKPVLEALSSLKPAGRLVINAIRKEEADKDYLLKIKYHEHLWNEKEIKSVANITRNDVKEFLDLAVAVTLIPETTTHRLEEANEALMELKNKSVRGAKVLLIGNPD